MLQCFCYDGVKMTVQLKITSDPYLKFRNSVLSNIPGDFVGNAELLQEINNNLRQYRARVTYSSYFVTFERESDLSMFLLRWS